MCEPVSSYSFLVTQLDWKVDSEDRIDPPIHTEYLRSSADTTFTFIAAGTIFTSSFPSRSDSPGYMVVPPLSTMFSYRLLLMSTSDSMIEL